MEAGYERVEEWNSLAGGTRSICPHAAFPCLCVCTCVRACVPFCARVLLGTAFLFPRSTAVVWGAAVAAPSQADEGNRLIVPVPLVGKQRPTAPQTNSPTKCPSRATGASTPKQPRRCRGGAGGGSAASAGLQSSPPCRSILRRGGHWLGRDYSRTVLLWNWQPVRKPLAAGWMQPQTSVKLFGQGSEKPHSGCLVQNCVASKST